MVLNLAHQDCLKFGHALNWSRAHDFNLEFTVKKITGLHNQDASNHFLACSGVARGLSMGYAAAESNQYLGGLHASPIVLSRVSALKLVKKICEITIVSATK